MPQTELTRIQPCQRCIATTAKCTYDMAYHRRPKQRKASQGCLGIDQTSSPLVQEPSLRAGLAAPRQTTQDSATPAPTSHDTQSPQEISSGDASARGFLARVYRHLSTAGHAMPRYLSHPTNQLLAFDNADATVILPDKSTVMSYLSCFAEHAQVTYRYVPQRQWQSLVTRLYDDDETLYADDANMALLLLVIGLGCIWYPSWKKTNFAEHKAKA
jgi:hypothetical protein